MTHPAVTVYSKPNCFPCRKTKEQLALRGVDFTEVDVTADPAAFRYVTETLKHQQVPVVVIDTPTAPVHWSGLVVALINEHFGPKPRKDQAA